MSSSDLLPFFEERYKEIEEYLSFLSDIERGAQGGPPRIEGSQRVISASQQKILYSSTYLQLYNLVEATVSRCIEAICDAAEIGGHWLPEHLNESLHQEWVRVVARTHSEMSPESRLSQAVEMSRQLISKLPIQGFAIEIGGGGNWDAPSIEKISKRVGCNLQVTRQTEIAAKRHIRDELGALGLVKNRRNNLAHGSLSFVDCADGVAVSELEQMTKAVGTYLREVIDSFVAYIDGFEFLLPIHKPVTGSK